MAHPTLKAVCAAAFGSKVFVQYGSVQQAVFTVPAARTPVISVAWSATARPRRHLFVAVPKAVYTVPAWGGKAVVRTTPTLSASPRLIASSKDDAALFLFDDATQELHVVHGGGQSHKVPTALVKGSRVVGLETAAVSTPGACLVRAVTSEGVEYVHEYDRFGLKQVV